MTHLLPGGGVPRVHRAPSPVPPRLPLLATPRSVHRLAAVAAGAYPPRRPPYVWSPGVPAPPGPCYWLVASGTPVGWRGGCLALGLVHGAVRHYCLGGCSALVVYARRSRQIGGVGAGAGFCAFTISPFPARVSCAVCGEPSRLGVPYPHSLVRHSMRSVRSAGSFRLPFWFSPRVLCVCVRSRCGGVHAPPLPGLVWRVHLARSRCWALVGPSHEVRAPACVLPRSRAPFGLFGGGGGGPISPYLAWGCALRAGWVRAWEPVTNPTARALASWLCALWGRHEGARGGAPLAWVWGVRGRALSEARRLVLSGVWPGPTTHWLWVRGLRALGPVTNPTARALASSLCALWGRHEGARGGRPSPGCGVSGVGRSPGPDRPFFGACGRGPLPTGCGCGGCGRGDPSPNPQRALLRAGFARCGGGTRAPGGGASCLGVGRPGSGALPPPTTHPFGRAAGANYPLAVGAGDAGSGTRHQRHSARSCELALRVVGAA